MLFKSIIIAAAIAACQASPLASPVEERASNGIGTVVAYSGTGYSGSDIIISVVQGAQLFCQEWTNVNTGKQLFEIKSFLAAQVSCVTFPNSQCTGNANGAIAVGHSRFWRSS